MDSDEHRQKPWPVRRVLRHKSSREYFTGSGWTDDLEAARSFQDSLEAAQTCVDCGLTGVEIVLRLKGGAADLFCTELR